MNNGVDRKMHHIAYEFTFSHRKHKDISKLTQSSGDVSFRAAKLKRFGGKPSISGWSSTGTDIL